MRDSLANRITIKNNALSLTGSSEKLETLGVPSFLAVRQTEHAEIFQVDISSESHPNNGAFGLAIMINNDHYATLTLEKTQNNKFSIYKHIKVLDLEVNEKIGELSDLPQTISITNTKDSKIFKATSNNQEISFTINAMHFSNEAIAALNTGDVQGIYATNDAVITITQASRRKIK